MTQMIPTVALNRTGPEAARFSRRPYRWPSGVRLTLSHGKVLIVQYYFHIHLQCCCNDNLQIEACRSTDTYDHVMTGARVHRRQGIFSFEAFAKLV